MEDHFLTESEQRFRSLVHATSDVVYRMSPDWSIMRQLEGSGFITNTGEPISGWIDKYIHPDDVAMVNAGISEAIAHKTMFQMEHRVFRTDGSIGWTFSRAVPIIDESGAILEWFGAANDVTPRKQMEQELKAAKDEAEQQKRLYEAVTSSTPDLIYVFDLNYTFTYANQALLTMWGKSWSQAIGKGLLENGYEPWHAEMHEREIDQVAATKLPIRGEVSFPHAVFGNRIYDYIFTPVINEFGEVEAVAGTTRDITDIKVEEERKNDFISMVSHELKTPLTSILGYLQVSKRKLAGIDETVPFLERAEKQLQKMNGMIEGFLNVSRLESGKIHLNRTHFDMCKLISEIQNEVYHDLESHQLIFELDAPVEVEADYDRIGQVVLNFLGNAIKYSPIGSTIVTKCKVIDGHARVEVHDQGIGIESHKISKIFERFYRVEEQSSGHVSGFGIGLYICSELIKLHGGQFGVESNFGEGSMFFFTIPIAIPQFQN